jgi:hypothetical protein
LEKPSKVQGLEDETRPNIQVQSKTVLQRALELKRAGQSTEELTMPAKGAVRKRAVPKEVHEG